MKQRTEEEAVGMEPLVLKLGKQSLEAKILPRKQAKKWRAHAMELLTSALGKFDDTPSEALGKALSQGLGAALLQFPDTLADLVAAWCVDLSEEERTAAVDAASDEQIAHAFSQVAGVAYPFFPQLNLAREIVKAGRSSPSAQSTKSPSVNGASLQSN
jgi:hypothetical protein